MMSTIAEIQQAILNLPEAEYDELIQWLYKLDEAEWDRQIESDSSAGKLDFLAAEATEAKQQGTLADL
jgi:hypothetical protein